MPVSRFFAFLVNDSFGDPGLFINCSCEKRALLFDLGDVSALSERQLLRISHIFITHAHVDHFFGFDRIIRLFLGKNKVLHLYGPPEISQNIGGKLSGYKWNMINGYKSNFQIHVTEIYENYAINQTYESKKKFKPSERSKSCIKNNIILSEKMFDVSAVTLDHGTACLGFSFQEKNRVKILPHKLKYMGLTAGKWIKHLKHCLYSKIDKNTELKLTNVKSEVISFKISDLEKSIIKIIPGQRITYITDVNLTGSNQKAMLKLAYKSTHLFIEATFTTEHESMAMKKYHLTAKQAGQVARMSQSRNYTLFHHSSRYKKNNDRLKKEAETEFRKTILSKSNHIF